MRNPAFPPHQYAGRRLQALISPGIVFGSVVQPPADCLVRSARVDSVFNQGTGDSPICRMPNGRHSWRSQPVLFRPRHQSAVMNRRFCEQSTPPRNIATDVKRKARNIARFNDGRTMQCGVRAEQPQPARVRPKSHGWPTPTSAVSTYPR